MIIILAGPTDRSSSLLSFFLLPFDLRLTWQSAPALLRFLIFWYNSSGACIHTTKTTSSFFLISFHLSFPFFSGRLLFGMWAPRTTAIIINPSSGAPPQEPLNLRTQEKAIPSRYMYVYRKWHNMPRCSQRICWKAFDCGWTFTIGTATQQLAVQDNSPPKQSITLRTTTSASRYISACYCYGCWPPFLDQANPIWLWQIPI